MTKRNFFGSDCLGGDCFEAEGEADGDLSSMAIEEIWNHTRIKVHEVDRRVHGGTTYWTARGKFYSSRKIEISPFMLVAIGLCLALQTAVIINNESKPLGGHYSCTNSK